MEESGAASDPVAADAAQSDALVERLFGAALGMVDLLSIYLGDRLGYYRVLADGRATTSVEFAARTDTAERYAREWLEQQAVTGLIAVDDQAAAAAERRYRLPAAHAEVLTESDSLRSMAPFARLLVGLTHPLPALLEAFRSGGGVPYPAYGADLREGVAASNRPMFAHLLGQEWFPTIPEIDARLRAAPPARVADIGCGEGWSSIAIARAYPTVRVDGFDLDQASVVAARARAEAADVADRVTFRVQDAADPSLTGRYDLACAFECIHDMAQPVPALRTMRGLVSRDGYVLVVDERVAETFTAPGDESERLSYGFSILHCLPVGMADQPSVGTGTVMRPAMLRRYAREAGFRDIEILPIENDLWRFYRLVG